MGIEESQRIEYTSPATCVPSDLDPIVSGALPIMSTPKKAADEEATKERPKEETE
jgi:hypothetical protein